MFVFWKNIELTAKLSHNEGGSLERVHGGALLAVPGSKVFWMQVQNQPIFICFKIKFYEDLVSKLN